MQDSMNCHGAHLCANHKILQPGFKLFLLWQSTKIAQQNNADTLPPCCKYNSLEAYKLCKRFYGLEFSVCYVVKLDEAIQGPHLAKIQNYCYIWVPDSIKQIVSISGQAPRNKPFN